MVLKLISEDKTYGYELIANIDRESQGLFKMKEGTLYPILYKLEDEGLIQSEWQNPEGKQKAKMFDLTILGVLLLATGGLSWDSPCCPLACRKVCALRHK